MPLYDYTCATCGAKKEAIVPRFDVEVYCPSGNDHGPMEREVSSPAMFSISGYSEFNGYSRGKVHHTVKGHEDMKVSVEAK